jgi:ribonuclease HII
MPCSFKHERAFKEQGIFFVAGIDEAGRGPLAGPVVAAAVVFLKHRAPKGLNDSKKLSHPKRESIYKELTESPHVAWSVSVQEVEVIDQINILQATYRAMRDAYSRVASQASHVLIDGRPVPEFPATQKALVGGDAISHSIAAASVIAKVTRDRIMEDLDVTYPHYGFRKHKGYGTAEHLVNLRTHGPCPVHRRSFSPVAQPDFFSEI